MDHTLLTQLKEENHEKEVIETENYLQAIKDSADWEKLEVLFAIADQIQPRELADCIINVDTRDWRFCITQRGSGDNMPKKVRMTPDVPSSFLTLVEVAAKLKDWMDKGFTPNEYVARDARGEKPVFNLGFTYIRIHQLQRGYLWCDQFGTHFPNTLLEAGVHFPTEQVKQDRSTRKLRQEGLTNLVKNAILDESYTFDKIREEITKIFIATPAEDSALFEASLDNLAATVMHKATEARPKAEVVEAPTPKKRGRPRKIKEGE